MFTYPGRIALTYDELIVVMCIAIWSIARGSDLVAGELGRGTMEVLLAQPVSRLRVLLTQATVTTIGVAILAGASWLGIYAGIHTTHVKEPVADPAIMFPMLGMAPPLNLLDGETRIVLDVEQGERSRHVAGGSQSVRIRLLPGGTQLAGLVGRSLSLADDRDRGVDLRGAADHEDRRAWPRSSSAGY